MGGCSSKFGWEPAFPVPSVLRSGHLAGMPDNQRRPEVPAIIFDNNLP